MRSSAYSPSHITGVFRICNGIEDPLRIGSIGAGVSLSSGVKTDVNVTYSTRPHSDIKLKSRFTSSGTPFVSERVISKFQEIVKVPFSVEVTHNIDVPVGSGFGVSGAAALSLAISLNDALGTGLSDLKVAQLAHIVELECKTGVGTVIAEVEGGIELRVKAGAPGIGKIERIESPRDSMVVAVTTGDMLTRTALEDLTIRKSINETSKQFLDLVFRERSLDSILRASRDFGRSLGFLTDDMNRLVDVADASGYVCGIAFFGKTIFSIVRENEVQDLSRIFLKASGDWQLISCNVSSKGAMLIGPRN